MMAKTAMMEFIDRIEEQQKQFLIQYHKAKGDDKKTWDHAMSALALVLMGKDRFLELEKKQIINTYNNGCTTKTDKNNGENYYTQTFPLR